MAKSSDYFFAFEIDIVFLLQSSQNLTHLETIYLIIFIINEIAVKVPMHLIHSIHHPLKLPLSDIYLFRFFLLLVEYYKLDTV